MLSCKHMHISGDVRFLEWMLLEWRHKVFQVLWFVGELYLIQVSSKLIWKTNKFKKPTFINPWFNAGYRQITNKQINQLPLYTAWWIKLEEEFPDHSLHMLTHYNWMNPTSVGTLLHTPSSFWLYFFYLFGKSEKEMQNWDTKFDQATNRMIAALCNIG